MGNPQHIHSGCYLVWFRPDLPRAELQAYWRDPHAQIAARNPAIHEYLQHHFSASDRGFWPAPPGVGCAIPPDWRIDGLTEVRIGGLAAALHARLFQMKANFLDEENLFDRVLGKTSRPRGGCWWTGPYGPDTGFRAVLFLRAHHALRGRTFRCFVENALAPALLAAGASELRTHLFQPASRLTHWTPGVLHNEPANRRYDGALIIGTRDRAAFDALLRSAPLQATQAAQGRHCVALHAYAVEATHPIVLDGIRQAQELSKET